MDDLTLPELRTYLDALDERAKQAERQNNELDRLAKRASKGR